MTARILLVGGKGSGKTHIGAAMACVQGVRAPFPLTREILTTINKAITSTQADLSAYPVRVTLPGTRDGQAVPPLDLALLDPKGGNWEFEGGTDESVIWKEILKLSWHTELRYFILCLDPATAFDGNRLNLIRANVNNTLQNLHRLDGSLPQRFSYAIAYTKADSYALRPDKLGRVFASEQMLHALRAHWLERGSTTAVPVWEEARTHHLRAIIERITADQPIRVRQTVEHLLENTWRLWTDAMYNFGLEPGVSFNPYFTVTRQILGTQDAAVPVVGVTGIGVAPLLDDFYDRYLWDVAWTL